MAHLDINLLSHTLSRSVTFSLFLPSMSFGEDFSNNNNHYYRDKRDKKYPIIFLFHGYLNDYNCWSRNTRCEMYADEHNIALCMISAENKFYVNMGDNFEDFIEGELMDYLYGTFPISERREDNFIAGLSMGGFGALYHGLKYPEKFSKIGAFSPVCYIDDNPLKAKRNLLEDFVLEHKVNLPDIYIGIGKKDFLLNNVREFDGFLSKNEISHEYFEAEGFEHEWRFWDMEIEKFIKNLKRSDSYKDEVGRHV